MRKNLQDVKVVPDLLIFRNDASDFKRASIKEGDSLSVHTDDIGELLEALQQDLGYHTIGLRIDTSGILGFEHSIAEVRISVLENRYDRMPALVPVDQRDN